MKYRSTDSPRRSDATVRHVRALFAGMPAALAILLAGQVQAGLAFSTPASPFDDVVPPEAERAESLATLRERYEGEYARSGMQARRDLAGKFLELASRPDADWTASDRYVLLDQARDLSVRGFDLPSAFTAIAAIEQTFLVDARRMRCETAVTVAPDVRYSDAKQAATLCNGLLRELLSVRELQLAEDLLDSAKTLAKKSRDDDLKVELSGLESALASAKRVAEAKRRLASRPDDPEANKLLGWHYFFEGGDFETGLPHLALSDDDELRQAATLDLKQPESPIDRKMIGDAWYVWGKQQSSQEKQRSLSRAQHWYGLAAEGLTRFDLVEVEDRIKEIETILGKLTSEHPGVESAAAPATMPAAMRRLEQSREVYAAEMDRLEAAVASELASLEAELADSGRPEDQARLARVRDAMEGLEEWGDFPLPPLIPASLQSRIDKTRAKHRKALERHVRDLSRNDAGELVEEVEQELVDFELEPAGLYERMSRMPPPKTSVQMLGERSRGHGRWSLEGNTLICPAGGSIVFGDPEWTDYDVVVTARIGDDAPTARVAGRLLPQLSIFARLDGNEAWELNAGGWGLSNRDLRPQVEGDPVWHESPHRVLMMGAQPTEPGDTYSLGLRLRGAYVTVLLNGEEARTGSHPTLRKGRVGLCTTDHHTAFLDVEVRGPEGVPVRSSH